jgi:hypothetical protein
LVKARGLKSPKSNLEVEVTIRSEGLEIRTRGSITELSKQISSLSDFAKWAASKIAVSGPISRGEMPLDESGNGVEPPVIKVSKNTSDNIRTLFETAWGRTPKGMEEVARALDVNAVPAAPSSIGMALIGLVKRGELRRIKKGGKWVYYHIPA